MDSLSLYLYQSVKCNKSYESGMPNCISKKVLKVFAIFCNAMYYSGPKISYMPFKISSEIYRLNRLYHFYKTTIAVPLVNMDFNHSNIFMEKL